MAGSLKDDQSERRLKFSLLTGIDLILPLTEEERKLRHKKAEEEKAAQEKAKLEEERAAKEKAEREKAERQKAEREKAEREKAAKEKAAKEKAEEEKAAKEKAEQEAKKEKRKAKTKAAEVAHSAKINIITTYHANNHTVFTGLQIRFSYTSDFKFGTTAATLPGAWRYRVSAGTAWSGVSLL